MSHLSQYDPDIAGAIENEISRQRNGLEMIASENFVSRAILEAMGTPLTNKYSEGYPGKRYYGGNEFIDVVENLARDRLKQLFGAEHANVQSHSGSTANMEAYFTLANLGDTIMAMNLAHGGHLTHGSPVNFSGKFYRFVPYGVRQDNHRIDMDAVRALAKAEKPKIILAGFTAYPREIDFKAFKEIADEVGALFMVDMAHIAGLIAAKIHPSPIPYADIVTTTTHKTLRGPRGAAILCKTQWAEKLDKAVMPGMQGGPLEHVIAAKAVAFKEALAPSFVDYAKQIVQNAKALATSLINEGLVLISGGTDNHLILLDLTNTGVTGKQAEVALDSVGIYTNKNMIPYDPRKPLDPSGLRIGTPALTTRGFDADDMEEIGVLVAQVVKNYGNETAYEGVRRKVKELTEAHPLYPGLTVL